MSVQLKLSRGIKGDGVAARGSGADPAVERGAATGTVLPPTAVSRGVDHPREYDAELKREKDTKGDGGKLLRSERYWGTSRAPSAWRKTSTTARPRRSTRTAS